MSEAAFWLIWLAVMLLIIGAWLGFRDLDRRVKALEDRRPME